MKRISLKLVSSIVALSLFLGACSKKQYSGFFNNNSNGYAHSSTTKNGINPTKEEASNNVDENITASTDSEITPLASENSIESIKLANKKANNTVEAKKVVSKLSLKEKIALKKIMKTADAKGGKSQIIALVLVLVVGGLGIHRFYLGYTWQGVVQLLTGGGCGIWWLIDLIRIVTGDLKPNGGNYDQTF